MNRPCSAAQARQLLSSFWPAQAHGLGGGVGGVVWLRARPAAGRERAPRLIEACAGRGAPRPDGMWVRLIAQDSADVMAFEVCGTEHDLRRTRSRYEPLATATSLAVPRSWLGGTLKIQAGGEAARWEASGGLVSPPASNLLLSVRRLRVLYLLPDRLWARWQSAGARGSHEFFAPQEVLRSFTSARMQALLARMAHDAQLRAA